MKCLTCHGLITNGNCGCSTGTQGAASVDIGIILRSRDAEIAALKADLEAARATIARLAEKIAQAVEDDTKRMREQIEGRRMFREIGSYSRMRFNRLLPRLHNRKDVSLTECFDLLRADLAAHKRALEAVDGAEPMAERNLRAVAHAGTWAEQRRAFLTATAIIADYR